MSQLMSIGVAAALVVGFAAPAAAQAPVRVGGDIKEPIRIVNVAPVYPPIAQQAGVQGVVILEVIIGVDGKVQQSRVLRPVPLLDQAAVDAVNQWEYTPTLVNGQPVPVVMTVTVTFTLDGGPQSVKPGGAQNSDVPAMLDYAKSVHQRGLYDEAERALLKALAAVQADRARGAAQSGDAAPMRKEPIRVGADVKEPVQLKHVDPAYPAGTPAGVTVADIVINEQGMVSEAKILKSRGADVDFAAAAALRQWRYVPTVLNGVAVPVIMTVTITNK